MVPPRPPPTPTLKVLISGAGIAGCVLAFWLLKLKDAGLDIHITIVERAPELRLGGASIDIRGSAVDIVKRMGLEATVRSMVTNEKGIEFVDDDGRVIATFGASGETEVQSFTSEFEIFRGDLTKIFYDAVKEREEVEFVWGDRVKDIKHNDTDSKVEVGFMHRASQTFDLVVAADGVGSDIRDLMLLDKTGRASSAEECYKPLNMFVSYFTVPQDLLQGSQFAKWHNATGGRVTFLRPDPSGATRGNLIHVTDGSPEIMEKHRDALKQGYTAYKKLTHEIFQDAGWMTPEVLEAMESSNDCYSSEVAQIRTDMLWHKNVVLVGDAGYCATPLTGYGTSLAIIGAYVLAGEILTQRGNVASALQGYQDLMLPFVKKVQYVPANGPQYLNPQTQWGIRVMRSIMSFVSWSRVDKLVVKLASVAALSENKFPMPDYNWPE
jgi:2-polyprenyl-6-methoxyphenol hydroxylase-like FAD-dependent oxidoreductase